MSKITKLKPRDGATVPGECKGAICGTMIEQALDEQRTAAWEIGSTLHMAAASLDTERTLNGDPDYSLVLRAAAKRAFAIAEALEGGPLEDRAAEIAREREAEQEGGAA